MKYILGFNEKLRIYPELENQVNSYYDEINYLNNANRDLFPMSYNYDSKDNVDQVMLFIANKFQAKNINIDKSFLQKVKDGFKKLIGKNYSKEEKAKIKEVKEYFEKDINLRIKKYRKKMYRIVTLMCDKYIKT